MNEVSGSAKRVKIYFYIILALFLMLAAKLAVVQLFYNDDYQIKARQNRVRILPVAATRGEIITSDGVLLASNELVYTVSINPIGNSEEAIARLVSLLEPIYPEITADYVTQQIKAQGSRQYEPAVIRRNIGWETVVQLEENRQYIPGLAIDVEPLRTYPEGRMAGHVLGYIHSINAEELLQHEDYSMNSLIGKSGLEKQYEALLKGVDGAVQVEVDSRGRPVGEMVTLDSVPGANLYLTLDSKLQTVLDDSMDQVLINLQKTRPKARVGSAVVLEVETGRVLALTSKPDLYPDDFKGNISTERAEYYFPQSDSYNPLLPGASTNRAIQTLYPPGSTFKPITAMAAIDKGALDPLKDYIVCSGSYWLAPYIACTGVHGRVNLYGAMAVSCNTYFQEAGRRAGKDQIIRVAQAFGLADRTGIDLPYEVKGLVPTPEWKREINSILLEQRHTNDLKLIDQRYAEALVSGNETERQQAAAEKQRELDRLEAQYKIDYQFDTNWQEYDTYNMSIGQGSNNYTVAELANYAATVANYGHLMQPYLVDKIEYPDGRTTSVSPQQIHLADVSPRTLEEVRQAMSRVTQGNGSASFLFANFPADIKVAAKTGTAQTGRAGDDVLGEFHGVFIAFAPLENPKIAYAGVIEYGQQGGNTAGLVCKAVFEQYFGIVDHYAALTGEENPENRP
jgi:penicillin-binding protein 2